MRRSHRSMEEKGIRTETHTPGVTERQAGGMGHSLQIANRESVVVTGVLAVESFDDEEIQLETEMGALTLRGEELSIKQLDLERGRFAVEGLINALQYSQPRQRSGRPQRSRGFLERLLK